MRATTGIGALAFAMAVGCGTTVAGSGSSGSGTTGSHGTTSGSSSGTGGSSGGSTGGCATVGGCDCSPPCTCAESFPNGCFVCTITCPSSSSGGTGSTGGSTGGGSSSGGSSTGGVPCQSDADCPAAGTYCDQPLTFCPSGQGLVTTSPGNCHRDCAAQGCACSTNADCPGAACYSSDGGPGTCAGNGGASCLAVNCPADCPETRLTEFPCPLCLCQSCPAPDAGASGPVCGLGPDAGTCGANQMCCEGWGGIAAPDAGPISERCYDLDGGCPAGASCGYDDAGAVASCNFYYP